MAAHVRRISLLLFGLVILTTYSARTEAEDVKIDDLIIPEEKDNGNAGHALTTRGLYVVGNVVKYYNDDGDDDDDADDAADDDSTNDEVASTSYNNSGKGKPIISGANSKTGSGSGDRKSSNTANTFSGMTISGMSNLPSKITSTSKTVEMNFNGIPLRAMNFGDKGVTISNNKIFAGGKLVCDNINKASAGEPTYQKLDDGSLWYTNIKIGKPMTKAEIDKFDADWAVYKKEEEERAERDHNKRIEEHNKRMEEHRKRLEELNKRMQEEQRQRMAEHNKRMEEHRQRMKQQAEERARRQKELMDAMNERLRKQAEERGKWMKRQAEDRERRANRASMNRPSSFW